MRRVVGTGLLFIAASGFLIASSASTSPLFAQAWVPEKRSGSWDVVYVRGTADRHMFSETRTIKATGETGRSVWMGDEYVNTAILRMDFGITDKLAVSGDLAFVSAKFNGLPQWEETELDNGTYHGTAQDARAELRYLAVQTRRFAFTPFGGLVLPTHEYVPEGHAAPGRGLIQIPLGFYSGYVWPRPIHSTWVEGRGAYSFLRDDENYDFSRYNAFFEAGTYLSTFFSIRGNVGWEKTIGGVDWANEIETDEDFETHDQRTESKYWGAGFGVGFDLGPFYRVSASYSYIQSGANVVDNRSFTVSWSTYFGGGPAARKRKPEQVSSLDASILDR